MRKNAARGVTLLASLTWGLAMLSRTSLSYFILETDIAPLQLGLLNCVSSLCYFVSALLISRAAERGGSHAVWLGLSLLAGAGGVFLTGASSGFAAMLAARALVGLSFGPVYTLTQSVVFKCSPPDRFALHSGIVTNGESVLSTILGPILLVALMDSVGWRKASYISAAPVFLTAAVWLSLGKPLRFSPERSEGRAGGVSALRALLGVRNVTLSALAGILSLVGLWIIYSYAPSFWTQCAGMGDETMSRVMTGMGVMTALYCVALPRLSDRFGRKPVCLILSALNAVSLLFLALAPRSAAAMWLFVAFGGGASVVCIFFFAVIPSESAPKELAGSAIAFANGSSELLGASLGPLFAGLIAERYGLGASMGLAAACMCFTALICAFFRETAPRAR